MLRMLGLGAAEAKALVEAGASIGYVGKNREASQRGRRERAKRKARVRGAMAFESRRRNR